jgi:hypothetical protein
MIDSRVGPLGIDAVVDGYIRYSETLRRGDPDADANARDAAAYDALEAAIRGAPAAVAWELVVTLLRRAPDAELDFHAAGPLENLVVHRAAELIGEIEAEAARDERFRWALGCIWLSRDEIPDDVLQRVVRASGGAIQPFRPLKELECGA